MKHIKKLIAMLLALSLICSLAACGSQNADGKQSSQQTVESVEPTADGFQPYTFVDDLGHEIEITEELTAIVPSGQLAQVMLLGIAPDLM